MTKESDLQSLLQRAGNDISAIDQIAQQLWQGRYPLTHALAAYKKYLAFKPDSAIAAFNYAFYLSKDGQFEAAIKTYQHALAQGIGGAEEVHLNIANIFVDHLHDSVEAKKHLQKSLAIRPGYANAYYNLGNLSEQGGEREEAIRCFTLCLKYAPDNESALARLVEAQRSVSADNPIFFRLVEVAKHSRNSDVHFVLGRAYDQMAEYDLAWSHFSRANELDKPGLPLYNPESTEAVFNQIRSNCNKHWLEQYQGVSNESVFICGMFRTGSTLLEQVFAAHPSFAAGGESQFFPRLVSGELNEFPKGLSDVSLAMARSWQETHNQQVQRLFGDSVRVTDKRPDNFLHIGLIKAVLPSAKFVVTQRDWRDVATSVFSTRLGPSQNYSTSLKSIRHYMDLQKRLVSHWQSVLGDDLIRVNYEDLVSTPRHTIGGLLERLGETWDERCLSFNKLKNAVQTASVWQVREPLHTKSMGRWKNYQTYFEQEFGSDVGQQI